MLAVKRVICYKECAFSRYTSLTSMFCKMTARHETQRSPWSVMLKERSVHSSTCLSGDNKLMKMLAKKKRKQWYESPVQATALQLGFLKPSKRNKEDSVRVRTLNNIIYKAVTDLLSSYEVNSEISAYNVQISKVSLPRDFSACRIYWKTSLSAEQDSHIQQALDKCAPRIRHLLISHQILGSVPPVLFIRDKQYAAITEIENLLKKADFGPDENNLHLSVNDNNIGAKLQPIESGDKKRPVLFGVDHDALHKQIEAYKRDKGARASLTQSPAAGGLTQEQLDTLADIRKQKLIEKKKQKSKWMKDDDFTPKDFLLSRSLQKEDKEEQDSDEDSQLSELMEEEDRRH